MSKRGADEYITKENGTILNTAQDTKVKMATAAQLAKRKMAAPKSRLNRSTPGTSPAPTSSNPFAGSFGGSSQPQQPQQSFQLPGGVTFGENKSFPTGTPATGGAFSFSAPQSSSFTFGQTSQNNPFASVNGNGNGSGGSLQQNTNLSEDAMMESPQKKSGFGGGFGNNVNGNTPFGGFGGQAAQPPSQPNFGISQPQSNGFGNSTSTSMFGQNQVSQGSNNLFGQPTPKPGSGSSFGQTNGGFGQSNIASSPFNFGQTTSTTPSQQSGFSFGQDQSQSQPPSQPGTSSFAFGQQSQPAPIPSNPPFQLGQQSGSTQPTVNATTLTAQSFNTNTLFGGSQQTPSANNLFGGFGTPKLAETQKAETTAESPLKITKGNFWTEPSTTAAPSESISNAKPNPFASLFGTDKKNDAGISNSNAPITSAEIPKSPFTFAGPSQPTGLFGSKPTSEAASTKEASDGKSSKSLFEFQSSQAAPASNMFSSQKPEANKSSVSALFGSVVDKEGEKNAALTSLDSGIDDKVLQKGASLFSFGQTTTPKPAATGAQSLFGGFKPTTQTVNSSTPSAPGSTPITGMFGQASGTKPATKPQPTPTDSTITGPVSVESADMDGPAPKRTVYSNPPARIPAWLSGDKYKSYDSNYRLHSLNREFQKRIASLNPSKQDFENILRSYVAARESIGESIGLYTRNTAGMKRKNDNIDEQPEEPPTAKRTRQSEPATQDITAKHQPTSSIFQPVQAPVPAMSDSMFGSFNSAPKATSPVKSFTPSNQNTSSLFKSMIPEGNKSSEKPVGNLFAGMSAQTTSAAATPTFTFGSAASNTIKAPTTDSTTPPSSPPKQSKPAVGGFKMPNFGASPAGTDFLSAFGKSAQANSEKFAREAREKRKAEEFDSDEDDEDAWNKKYEEEEKARRSKIEAAKSKSFMPTFGAPSKPVVPSDISSAPTSVEASGTSTKQSIEVSDTDENDDDASDEQETDGEDDLPEDHVDEEAETEDDNGDSESETITIPPGQSLFNRITRDSTPQHDHPLASKNESSAPTFGFKSTMFGSSIGKSTPEAPDFSPITPSTNTPYVPSKTFTFTPTPKENPSPFPGASVFDGGLVRDGPIPGEGLFGSRSSTPVNGDKPTSNLFGGLGSSQSKLGADHTWKKGFDIKFGTSTADAPSVNITAPSPQPKENAKPFGSLFGAPSGASSNSSTPGALGFSFGASTSTPAPGFLAASSHLVPNSATSSAMSSRATSPGGTDNESVATDNEDAQSDPQSSLISSNPGEEDEDVLYEGRAKALKLYTAQEVEGTKKSAPWNTEGIGPIRILKHRNTGRCRVVVRADPGANIIMNFNLMPDVTYTSSTLQSNGGVRFVNFSKDGKPETWTLKVKNRAVADELASVMERNKVRSNS